jgi:hypothetical protein
LRSPALPDVAKSSERQMIAQNQFFSPVIDSFLLALGEISPRHALDDQRERGPSSNEIHFVW